MMCDPFDVAMGIEKLLVAKRISAHEISAHELILMLLGEIDVQ